jgi:very-short-patch-repair endonuclease
MNGLQRIVSFWRDCITAESALEQSFVVSGQFRLSARVRAQLFRGGHDPFIFGSGMYRLDPDDGLYDFAQRSSAKGQEVYFGYPLLMFYDQKQKQHKIAPLFVMRLHVEAGGGDVRLSAAESAPTLGSKAFEILGLDVEEIAQLNSDIAEVFAGSQKSKLETVLYILQRQTVMTFVEGIDPTELSHSSKVQAYSGAVVYNRAVVYASEATSYNLHVLNDLNELAKRQDLSSTALGYLEAPGVPTKTVYTPVLPFAFDEYQLQAIDRIMRAPYTVVTGPPGTGKSQFIANLIINLFLQKKRVLFVSHTGEAVRVVNERVNDAFLNLMMQTGRKEIRQDLGARLQEMVSAYNEERAASSPAMSDSALKQNWRELQRLTKRVRRNSILHARLSSSIEWRERVRRRSLRTILTALTIRSILWRLKRRSPTATLLRDIEDRKTRHVLLSSEYVSANYLHLILQNEHYGKLAAYIEAVQMRRPLDANTHDHAERYVDAALSALNVWSCTLKSLAATFPLKANLFDYVIFDEASQIDLPSAAPALYRAKRLVVVGDAKQLLHITKITQDVEDELAKANDIYNDTRYPSLIGYRQASLFNSAKRGLREPEQQLKNHYRSSPQIANLFSNIFYGGALRLRTPEQDVPKGIPGGVSWQHVAGTAYRHKNGSRYNKEEAEAITTLVREILPKAARAGLSIGVATPYGMQRDLIDRQLRRALPEEARASIRVLTVHQFQGSEVDILLFSPVLAMEGDDVSDYWYLKNEQILNVGVSRARRSLILVGDRDFALASQSKLRNIAEYCMEAQKPTSRIPDRPMNVFERQLLALTKPLLPKGWKLQPQFVVGGRYTVDFALISPSRKIAVELDGGQHEIIGGLPVYADSQRDAYLVKHGWQIVRIGVHELPQNPENVRKQLQRSLRRTRKSV